jgi:hypothetical protein
MIANWFIAPLQSATGIVPLWSRLGSGTQLISRLSDIGEGRIRDMDATGIDMQILSITSPGSIINLQIPSRFAHFLTFPETSRTATPTSCDKLSRTASKSDLLNKSLIVVNENFSTLHFSIVFSFFKCPNLSSFYS